MQLQIPETELSNYKSRDLIPLKCLHCQKIFYRPKNVIQKVLQNNKSEHRSNNFCSIYCRGQHKSLSQQITCKQCNKSFQIKQCQLNKFKTHFCSKTCRTLYHNQHKSYGYHRSKLELCLEEALKKEFPTLNIIFNDRKTIGYELDIYIPSKQLAIEINGIFHYKPIYKGYQRTVEIDKLKQKLCQEKQIQLHILNISQIRKILPKTSDYYFNQIKNLVLTV